MEQRIANERDPNLRDRVPRSRIAVSWNNPSRRGTLRQALTQFRAHLSETSALAAPPRRRARQHGGEGPRPRAAIPLLRPGRGVRGHRGRHRHLRNVAGLHVSPAGSRAAQVELQPRGPAAQALRRYTHEELTNTPFGERRATSCERGRWPVYVELDLDGKPLYRGTHEPAGLWNDGPSSVYARFEVPAGRHRLDARLRDGAAQTGFGYTGTATVELEPGENFVVDFRAAEGGFTFAPPAPAAPPRGAP